MKWPLCGPKLSLCCTVISVWGIIQFILLGIFFFIEAAPLLDDFDPKNTNITSSKFGDDLKDDFHVRAINCWIAAALYIALLLFSGFQFKIHMSDSSSSNPPRSFANEYPGTTTDENGYGSQHGIQFSNNETDS